MREAQCGCGNLKVTTEGEPTFVIMCHCEACQRRTGAPYGVGAYFEAGKVSVSGDTKSFARPTDSGRTLTNHFCPTCGTNVYWEAESLAGFLGVAVGCFTDPDFPKPQRSVFTKRKHAWMAVPDGADVFEESSFRS
jgi:hypothetical protein